MASTGHGTKPNAAVGQCCCDAVAMLVPSETRAWTAQIGVPLLAKLGQAAIKWKVPCELARRMVHTTEARRFAEQRA